ncbi:MAG: hypothetical protein PHQ35_10830 [Phycisphaerae bacterium]|nr:hypothetical protein [Phycisphaerae bacterium]
MHKIDGKWSVKQTCSSHENAVKALGLLEGLESGSIKREDVGKGKYSSNSENKGQRKYKVLYKNS